LEKVNRLGEGAIRGMRKAEGGRGNKKAMGGELARGEGEIWGLGDGGKGGKEL